jgi:hypothetical protein
MTMMSQNSHERAAAELERGGGVALELEEIEARRRRVGERHGARFAVERLGMAALEIATELRPYVFGLARDDGIGERLVALGEQRGIASARDDTVSLRPVVGEEFRLPLELRRHAAHADHVRARRKRHCLDVLVHDLDRPVRRREGGERRQPERRIYRSLAGKNLFERPAKAPEAFVEAGVDQQQPHRHVVCR